MMSHTVTAVIVLKVSLITFFSIASVDLVLDVTIDKTVKRTENKIDVTVNIVFADSIPN